MLKVQDLVSDAIQRDSRELQRPCIAMEDSKNVRLKALETWEPQESKFGVRLRC